MSSKSITKRFVKIEYKEEDVFNLKSVIIPFSLFFLKDERFTYDGREKMPFDKRDPLFKIILLQEFSGILKNIKNKTFGI